jgi:hypothetical protein
VRTVYLVHLGKEANTIEAVEAGLEHDPDEVHTEYADPRRDPWRSLVLRRMPMDEHEGLGMHWRSLFAIRAGERSPHRRNRGMLIATAVRFAVERLSEAGIATPGDDVAACTMVLRRAKADR